jgi:D-arabinose 1-dehydrogenase-like Zn-dependent alcohol dehydrogenase
VIYMQHVEVSLQPIYSLNNFNHRIVLIDSRVRPPLPLILGHEGVGRIVELGSNVIPDKHHLKIGDLIGLQFIQGTCLQCESCLNGQETCCKTIVATGFGRVCYFSEHVGEFCEYFVGRCLRRICIGQC